MWLGAGIVSDLKARAPWYWDDWKQGWQSGYRIFAPATYIFFATIIPALAFGEQIAEDTDGAYNGVQVLISTAIFGILQSLIGGQPLLILGVAEPIILMFIFLYKFVEDKDDVDFLPFTSWVCIWTGIFVIIPAVCNACRFIDRFTRFCGEIFGLLIAILFMQQAIKGFVLEFRTEGSGGHRRALLGTEAVTEAEEYSWRLANGLWAVMLGVGLLLSSMLMRRARSWVFFKGGIRSFLADYGVPCMVVVWSFVSYCITGMPDGLPRRLNIPSIYSLKTDTPEGELFSDTQSYSVFKDLSSVPTEYIFIAIIPALIVTGLQYFDHNVSAQLGQQAEFNLKKPPSYNYDFLLLGFFFIACGLTGLPPANCVIPQAPMHTKSLVTLKRMLQQRDASAERKRQAATGDVAASAGESLKPIETGKTKAGAAQPPFEIAVQEQRLTGLLQSLFVLACLPLTPVIRKIPKGVLWGYFAFMAVESLPGSEFWDRLMLIFTDVKCRKRMLEGDHAPYLELVPFKNIMHFTFFQLFCLAVCWGITWAGFFGIFFPVAICVLIPFRQYVMPKMFPPQYLAELDAAEYEQAPPLDPDEAKENVIENAAHEPAVDWEQSDPAADVDAAMTSGTIPQPKVHLTQEQMRMRKSSMTPRAGAHGELSGAVSGGDIA